jgi:hypothetical protein
VTVINIPSFIDSLRIEISAEYRDVVDAVWSRRNDYVRWPQKALLFMPGATRNDKYHSYTVEHKLALKAAGILPDARSNGPAIMSFLMAGGERPSRSSGRGWHIHHIYDGKYPAPGKSCTRSVLSGETFSEAAGLVAIHPIADAMADEFAYFSWLLRFEAYRRFEFDPDGVFTER